MIYFDLLHCLIDKEQTPVLFSAVHEAGHDVIIERGEFKNYMQIFRGISFHDWDARINRLHELLRDIEHTITSKQEGGQGLMNRIPFRIISGCPQYKELVVFWLRQPFILSHDDKFEWVAECTVIPRIYCNG